MSKERTPRLKDGLWLLWGRPIVPPFGGHDPMASLFSLSSKVGWCVSAPALATRLPDGTTQTVCPTAAPSLRLLGPEMLGAIDPEEGADCLACVACYPRKPGAHYQMAAPKNAGAWRVAFANWCMRHDQGLFIRTYEAGFRWIIKQKQNQGPVRPVVRIHDSGDFWHGTYAYMLYEAMKRVPQADFWVSTRVMHQRPGLGPEELFELEQTRAWVRQMAQLPHVAVRQSAMGIITSKTKALVPGFHWPMRDEGLSGGTIIVDFKRGGVLPAGAWLCPAGSQGHKCDGREHGGTLCRACNVKDDRIIAYVRI